MRCSPHKDHSKVPEALSTRSGERALLQDFIEALRSEHDALVAGRVDDVAELAGRKLDCARRLEDGARPEFLALLRDARQRSRHGMPAANAESTELFGLVRQAAELNRINGALIDQHLKQVRLSLSRIDPVSPTRQLYGRDGQGGSGLRGRSFGTH